MSANRRPRREGTDPGTRQKVIDAAIRCILEQGFYRSSSNAIAEAAGLSWGVIQYYFGSREALMLGVLDEGSRRLVDDLSKARITATTITERLEQYFNVLEGYYGEPDYLAFIQVLLNLSHDPRTSDRTLDHMTRATKEIDEQLARLTGELFAGTKVRRTALTYFPFHILRGMALSEVMLNTLPGDTEGMKKAASHQRNMLIKAVTLLLESEGVDLGS